MERSSPFLGPRRKLAWGERHKQTLEGVLADFLRAHPFRPTATPFGVTVQQFQPFPNEVPLILGDAVHNLRTALDLLAGELVALNQQSPKGVYFPFSETPEDLEAQIVRRKFQRAGEASVNLLREIKPYRGGNVLLRALHDLDNMDKHQLILPVLHAPLLTGFDVSGRDGTGIRATGVSVGPGVYFQGVGLPENAGSVSPLTLFGDGAPAPVVGRPVFQTLEDMAKVVRGVIEAFERLHITNTPVTFAEGNSLIFAEGPLTFRG